MNKKVFGKKFSRSQKARRAFLRSLTAALMESGKITVTAARAKVVSQNFNILVSKAKRGTLTARRKVLSAMGNRRKTVDAIFKLAGESKRQGGFVKITPMPNRKGDNAPMAKVEIIKEEKKEKKNENIPTKS